MSDMTSCFITLSEWHRSSLLSLDEIKTGINFLAVMQQGSHELYHIALKLYDLDLALVTAQGMEISYNCYVTRDYMIRSNLSTLESKV